MDSVASGTRVKRMSWQDWTHFFHPALLSRLAYMVPIAPMPIKPMAGCSDRGRSGVTVADTLMGRSSYDKDADATSVAAMVGQAAKWWRKNRCLRTRKSPQS